MTAKEYTSEAVQKDAGASSSALEGAGSSKDTEDEKAVRKRASRTHVQWRAALFAHGAGGSQHAGLHVSTYLCQAEIGYLGDTLRA